MDGAVASDGASVSVRHEHADALTWRSLWVCEQWSEEACDFARRKLGLAGDADVASAALRSLVGGPELVQEVAGNLLLNEGIARLLDLLIGAGGVAFNNANSYTGVGDSATAEAATQTELQATQAAANRFYKAMNATYPSRTNQTVSFQSDFATSEANFAWNEWTVAAGATTASGSGFLVGTTNLNRKVAALGTKASGTWTLLTQITIS